MAEKSVQVSDPARDFINAIDVIESQPSVQTFKKISSALKVDPWSRNFYHGIKLLQDNLDTIASQLRDDDTLDADDHAALDQELGRIYRLFDIAILNNNWTQCCATGEPVGPEARTFLKSSSRQLRASHSYGLLDAGDLKLIVNTIEFMRADMGQVQLERADFAREALLRGCDEISFIVSRIDMFGFTRLEQPLMEIGAFLYTVTEEVRRTYGNDDHTKRSMASLSAVYERVYRLTKVIGAGKALYDGASWLITHLRS